MLSNIEPQKMRRCYKLTKEFIKISNLPFNDEMKNSEFNRLRSINPPAKLYNTLKMEHFNPKTIWLRKCDNSAPEEWLPI